MVTSTAVASAGFAGGARGTLRPATHMIVVSLLVGLQSFILVGCGDELPRIDLHDGVKAEAVTTDDDRPALRIAIAAMISPASTREYYEDIVRLIAERLDRRPVFVQRRTYAEVNELLEANEVDLAFICSGAYVLGHDHFGLEPLVVPVVNGEKVYYSYIIVHRDSPLTSFDELHNRRFAFTDPNSNTGRLVPVYMLALRNTTPSTFFSETFFTFSHDGSIRAVAGGQADGAAVDSHIWEFLAKVEPGLTNGTKVIERSPPYGTPPVVVRPNMNTQQRDIIRDLFLGLHHDPNDAELLARLNIERFDTIDHSAYNAVWEMHEWTQNRVLAEDAP